MKAIETFHHTFSGADTYTFNLGFEPGSVLVKNLTGGQIKFSFGDEIDTENDSYVLLLKNTAEIIDYNEWDGDTVLKTATVQADSAGVVEIRILED